MKKRIKNSWRRRSALVILLAALVLLLAPGAVSRGEGTDEKRETALYLAGEEGADGGLLLTAVVSFGASGQVRFQGGSFEETVPVREGLAQATVPSELLEETEEVSFSACYTYQRGREFAKLPQTEAPVSMIYGETAPVLWEEGMELELSVSDCAVLKKTPEGEITAAGPGTAYLIIIAAGEGENPSMEVRKVVVEKRPISMTGGKIADKLYDGNESASFTEEPELELQTAAEGDSLHLALAPPRFEDKNAGDGKQVFVSARLEGERADCYSLEPLILRGTIKKAPLEVSYACRVYEGQPAAPEKGLHYAGFVNGETAKALEEAGAFTPGTIRVDWDRGILQDDGPEGMETVLYPVSIEGAEAGNYEISLPEKAYLEKIFYLGREGKDFVLEYDGSPSWITGELTVRPAEGSGYTLVSKTEDFEGAESAVIFSEEELEKGTVSFYMKKGAYDPCKAEDSGAVARVTDLSLPGRDFWAPVLSEPVYAPSGRREEAVQAASSPEELADINRFYGGTVQVRFKAQDAGSGLKSALCEWVGENGGARLLEASRKEPGGFQEFSFSIEPGFRGCVRITLEDLAGHRTVRVCDYLAIAASAPAKPTVRAFAGGKPYSAKRDGWTSEEVEIRAEGAASLLGIAAYQYTSTDGGEPQRDAGWTAMEAASRTEGAGALPENTAAARLLIRWDTGKTYWIRAVENGEEGGVSEPVPIQVLRVKTPPPAPSVSAEDPGPAGWYGNDPGIRIRPAAQESHPAPMTVYYKLWNEEAGETEESARTVEFAGESPRLEQDGRYSLLVWSEDAAGNRSALSGPAGYLVDTQPPSVVVGGVRDLSSSRLSVRPVIVCSDQNLDERAVSVRLAESSAGEVPLDTVLETSEGRAVFRLPGISQDGNYRLTVRAADLAGNETAVIFGVFMIVLAVIVLTGVCVRKNRLR